MMTLFSTEEIKKTVARIVEDLIQDWGLGLDDGIRGSTKLVADLEFASVDIIQLCVAIERHYQQRMGFQSLLMKDGSYVSDLSIAQVAEFLVDKIKRKDL